ncbi:MAG: hypothetical protein KKB50_08020 [Planctomycetes bacterium]|nr:hypothetical protein [Planctomycetota bacterium]
MVVRVLLGIWASAAALGPPGCQRPMNTTRPDNIDAALDRIDTAEFFLPTAICSGYDHVRRILESSAEVKLLTDSSAEAAPRIVRRIEDGRLQRPSETLCALFLVLELSGDQRGLPVVRDYLAALPDSEAERIGWPWHPFNYGLEAVYALAGLGQVTPTTESFRELFARRREIVARARAAPPQER